ncbi:MAG TPA: glycosyltransferase [Candidatus Angelobacter sp.]|nr:glycosyltransferase [Candidatus Angelobacter sp.]
MEPVQLPEEISSGSNLPEQLIQDFPTDIRSQEVKNAAVCQYREGREEITHEKPDTWDRVLCAMVLAGLAMMIYGAVAGNWFRPVLLDAESSRWAHLVIRPAILWSLMGTVLLAFRTILWFRYRSAPSATMQDAPSLTVIIPAYNEGPMVRKSIESVMQARYPQGRLQVIVVDDGSVDDTWIHIQNAAAEYPGQVITHRLPRNRGKREALATGFNIASGEIVVTLDSDSVIDSVSLLAIAGPFRNPRVGAVAGKVKVYNRSQGVIPRMLHVRYILSFDMLRASESGFGTVYCCPGALTAYRTSLVRQVLQRWVEQKFLGAPCTIGEDRSLTNLILSCGFDTVYQRSAPVHTVTPISYGKLCRMLLRWDRSYVREELMFLRIVWKRPLASRLISLWDRLITNTRYPVHYACLALLFITLPHHPLSLVRLVLIIGVISALNTLYYLRSERSPDFFYGILYSYYSLFALFWIFPFALCTVRSRGWLTR